MLLSLTFRENTISNLLLYIHTIEISTNKGAKSYKLTLSKIENTKTCTSDYKKRKNTSYMKHMKKVFEMIILID